MWILPYYNLIHSTEMEEEKKFVRGKKRFNIDVFRIIMAVINLSVSQRYIHLKYSYV